MIEPTRATRLRAAAERLAATLVTSSRGDEGQTARDELLLAIAAKLLDEPPALPKFVYPMEVVGIGASGLFKARKAGRINGEKRFGRWRYVTVDVLALPGVKLRRPLLATGPKRPEAARTVFSARSALN